MTATKAKAVCDVCGRPTDHVVVKLFKVRTNGRAKVKPSDYDEHVSVGVCCIVRVNEIRWRERRRRA